MLTSAEKEAAADHKVRIVEFEDLECPACAAAAPIVKTALEHYKIDFDRHDFLIQSHIWSKNAAIIARYLQDKVSPEVAEEYRRDVFKNQVQIGSRDDLDAFSQKWFTAHKLQMPFNLGPDSVYALEVQSDCNAGVRLGLMHTPTIVVVGPRGWIEVSDVSQLYTAIDMAEKQAPVTAAHNNLKKPVSTNAH
jgi:protein-disulfide isomerase